MKKIIVLMLIMVMIFSLSSIGFSESADEILKKDSTISKPEFLQTGENLMLNAIDWVLGILLIVSILGLIIIQASEYFGVMDDRSAREWKQKVRRVASRLLIGLLAKQGLVFLWNVFTT